MGMLGPGKHAKSLSPATTYVIGRKHAFHCPSDQALRVLRDPAGHHAAQFAGALATRPGAVTFAGAP